MWWIVALVYPLKTPFVLNILFVWYLTKQQFNLSTRGPQNILNVLQQCIV